MPYNGITFQSSTLSDTDPRQYKLNVLTTPRIPGSKPPTAVGEWYERLSSEGALLCAVSSDLQTPAVYGNSSKQCNLSVC